MELFRLPFKIGSFVMFLWGSIMLIPISLSGGGLWEIMAFVKSALCCYLLAFVSLYLGRGYRASMKPRPLFLATSINWLLLSVTGALPYVFFMPRLSTADALFESVSGVTTTGSTALTGLEFYPHSLLLWRSITQWVGGIGIILMAVAVLPYLKVGGMRLFKTESSEWAQLDSGHIYKAAKYISVIYLGITLICFMAYLFCGMHWFDALNHSLTTVSTGGYSTSDASFARFDDPDFLLTGSLFMMLGGCPFFLYIKSIQHGSPLILRDKQVQLFIKLVLVMVTAVSCGRLLASPQEGVVFTIAGSAFNIISIITTTGYASEDYGGWGSWAVVILAFLMFSGACSGSTSGGIKLFRFQLLSLFVREHLFYAVHPKSVQARIYNHRPVNEEVLVASLAFFFFVIISWFAVTVLLAASGLDPVTALSGSLTALMNVGPGFGNVIGPTGNFSSLPDSAKYILCGAMLLGRLEYLTLVVLFTREFWVK